MNRLVGCALSGLLLVAGFPGRAQSRDANTASITHATVVDVVTGKELADQTVVIQDGRIISLAGASSRSAPEGKTIDARGGFLIPGLWDMHVHIQDLADLPLYIANGVTGVRMMSGERDTKSRREELATAVVAPEIIVGSAIVDGNPPLWPGSIVIKTPDDARRTVDSIKQGGADFVKVYSGVPRDAYFALADEAKQQGIPFVGHLPFAITAQEASDAGQRSIEHLDGIAFGCSKHESQLTRDRQQAPHYVARMNVEADAYRSIDAKQCNALFQQFRRNGTWQVPTLTVNRSLGMLDDRRFTSDQRLVYMNRRVQMRWQPENDPRFRRWRPEFFQLKRSLFSADERMVGLMFRAGVPLMAGTDAMNPFCFPGFSLHDELALLVESGLTPLAAVQASTLNPSVFLGRSDIGTIAPGKRADLVLLDADPLADIHNTTRIRAVWLRGEYFNRGALDQILENAEHRKGGKGE
jgi:Amidohydrolase family